MYLFITSSVICRGWRDLVQNLGLMRCAELLVDSREKAKQLLKGDLFTGVGTLYISGSVDLNVDFTGFEDDLKDDEGHSYNDYLNEMLTCISECDETKLNTLKISYTQVNPDVLGEVVCKMSSVELEDVGWKTSENLEHFLQKIINCQSLSLQSLTYKDFCIEDCDIWRDTDPYLLGIVAVKMKEFRVTANVIIADALVKTIVECRDLKLEVFKLDVAWMFPWIPDTSGIVYEERCFNVHSGSDFYRIYKAEIADLKSKLKSLTLTFNRGFEDDDDDYDYEGLDYGIASFGLGSCDHDRIVPWCDWCQEIADEYGLEDWM